LQATHKNAFKVEEANLLGIGTEPRFAIGQRALLIQTPSGNILWDCISLIDAATIQIVDALGGLTAIAISHPHFYSCMVEWSHAFDVPIYLHAANRQWVMNPDPAIQFWEGESYHLGDGLTLIRCGGHFDGSTVLHWSAGAQGRGVILAGDTLMVASDRRSVSFMYSFPNYLPLSAAKVKQIVQAVEPYQFDRIYSAWFDRLLPGDAKEAVARSAARYRQAIGEEGNRV
jgi:glyoxylase-like metal-dependent hydrolase (beta-lactamase superfamily II)